ncbi:hypothetical protein NMG60_11015393 [Bertholletia excelsa]
MRSLSAFFLLSLLFWSASLSDGRPGPEEYWRSTMRGEAMPKAIKELYAQDPASEHFKRDFKTKATVIIYHSHGDHSQSSKPVLSSSSDAGEGGSSFFESSNHKKAQINIRG